MWRLARNGIDELTERVNVCPYRRAAMGATRLARMACAGRNLEDRRLLRSSVAHFLLAV